MNDLTHLSLFSGIGGLDLAAEWAGFRTVGQCEWADYPLAVLEKHWPGLPRWRDIRTLTGDDFFAKTGLRTVTVLSGGFPCQPFSTAGKRRGKDDDRYLWPEMLRVIQEIRPAWVVGENVAGIVSMALDTVLSDLESIGYACQALVIPACAVDAPHRRDRVCILGRKRQPSDLLYSDSEDKKHTDIEARTGEKRKQSESNGLCKTVSYSDSARQQGCQQHGASFDGEPCCAVSELCEADTDCHNRSWNVRRECKEHADGQSRRERKRAKTIPKPIAKTCLMCGKEFVAASYRNKYCGQFCASRAQAERSLANSRRKKGGITNELEI